MWIEPTWLNADCEPLDTAEQNGHGMARVDSGLRGGEAPNTARVCLLVLIGVAGVFVASELDLSM